MNKLLHKCPCFYFRSANSLATTEIERIWIPFIVFENTEDNEATV